MTLKLDYRPQGHRFTAAPYYRNARVLPRERKAGRRKLPIMGDVTMLVGPALDNAPDDWRPRRGAAGFEDTRLINPNAGAGKI